VLQFIFPHAMAHPMTAVVKTLLDQVLMAPAGEQQLHGAMHIRFANGQQTVSRGVKVDVLFPLLLPLQETDAQAYCVAYQLDNTSCPPLAIACRHAAGAEAKVVIV
jgi:hypothetical protein